MQASKTNASRVEPALLPQATSKEGRLEVEFDDGSERDGGEMFAAELNRATNRDTGEGHRTEREASTERHARQAVRGDRAEAARVDAREGRQVSGDQRAESRSQRAGRTETVGDSPVGPREVATGPSAAREQPAGRPDRVRQQDAPAAGRDAEHTQVGPALDVRGAVQAMAQLATPEQTRSAATAPASSAAPAAMAPRSGAGQSNQQGSGFQAAPGTQTESSGNATRQASQPMGFTDVLGEMLLAKEADLDRQATVLNQLKAQLGTSGREISLQLSPAALGQINMRIALRSGRLTAVVRASKQEALDALQNQLPELSTSLEAQGIEVVDFDLALLE